MDIKRILATTDFSPRADQAVARAAWLAQRHGAELHLLHAAQTTNWSMFGNVLGGNSPVSDRQLFESAQERLKNIAKDIDDHYAVTTRWHVDIARPYRAMLDYGERNAIDLTVLGAHAEHFTRDLFVGTTALKFLHQTSRAALITHGKSVTDYRKVLVGIDFSAASSLAVDAALTLAPDAVVHLLHVYEVMYEGKMRYAGVAEDVIDQYRIGAETEALRRLNEFIVDHGWQSKVRPLVLHGVPSRVMLDQASVLGADLVAMGKHGETDLQHLMLGSVTENVLVEIGCDLLLITGGT